MMLSPQCKSLPGRFPGGRLLPVMRSDAPRLETPKRHTAMPASVHCQNIAIAQGNVNRVLFGSIPELARVKNRGPFKRFVPAGCADSLRRTVSGKVQILVPVLIMDHHGRVFPIGDIEEFSHNFIACDFQDLIGDTRTGHGILIVEHYQDLPGFTPEWACCNGKLVGIVHG